jgi:hypothetical protein
VVKKRIDKKQTSKEQRKELLKRENYHCVFPQLRRNRIPKVYQVLQFKGILEPTIEQFDVEELQGVSGLQSAWYLTSLTLIAIIIRAIPIRNYLTNWTKPELN